MENNKNSPVLESNALEKERRNPPLKATAEETITLILRWICFWSQEEDLRMNREQCNKLTIPKGVRRLYGLYFGGVLVLLGLPILSSVLKYNLIFNQI